MISFIPPKHKLVFSLLVVLLVLAGVITWVTYPLLKDNGSEITDAYSNWETYSDVAGVTFKYPESFNTKYIDAFDWPPQVQILDETFSCIEAGNETRRAGETQMRIINGKNYCVTAIVEGAAGSIYTQYAYAYSHNEKTIILTFSTRASQCANYNEPEKTECENERMTFNLDSIVDGVAHSLVIAQGTIKNFESCVVEGNPVMESYPRQCRDKDGNLHVEEIETNEQLLNSGIRGTVLLGPICPVERDPPDPECADRAFSTQLQVIKEPARNVVMEFSSDANGKFNVPLAPGEYSIRGKSTNVMPACNSQIFTVSTGKYTDLVISCDSGIR